MHGIRTKKIYIIFTQVKMWISSYFNCLKMVGNKAKHFTETDRHLPQWYNTFNYVVLVVWVFKTQTCVGLSITHNYIV
jgi:hypothetical protein